VGLKAYFFLLIALFAIPITLQKWFLGKKNTDLEFRLAPKERESHYLFQVLTGLPWAKESRTYGLGSPFLLKFKEIRKYIAGEKDIILKKGIKESLIIDLFEIAFTACILFYLSNMALKHQISLGIFILYLQGIQRMQATSKSLFQSLLQMFQLRTFVRDLYAFLQIPTIHEISKQKKNNPIYDLRIENLGFRYPNIERPILSNINLSAKKGQVIAIVGENGSGKSTLVKILAGLYKQQEGKVLLNGISAEEDYWLNWHKAAQFLFQDFQQYQMTVEGNIHFMHTPTESETEQAIKAAKRSGAHPFVVHLADQYQTELGNLQKNSVQLSGGQWQKLALSRLFNKSSEIIVLDEPSSSLDAFAERDLYENIRKSFAENIVILISHRLYNLKMADKIYVINDGRIEDEGTFNELISREGVFLNLYQNQKI
jgi:ATP-binding cassette subfamily B protein